MRHHRQPAWHWRLRHRLFASLAGAIVISVVVAAIVLHPSRSQILNREGLWSLIAAQLPSLWERPQQRTELLDSASEIGLWIVLTDTEGKKVDGSLGSCKKRVGTVDVWQGQKKLGMATACIGSPTTRTRIWMGLGAVVLVLWAMSGAMTRRLVRPLDDLVRVARELGNGNLGARMGFSCSLHDEVGEVAFAINQMAEKLERQLAGHKELLAAVSHELRSPLARLGILVELARESPEAKKHLSSMEAELAELDTLVGRLLAQSRLEFESIERRPVVLVDLVRTALTRVHANAPLDDRSEGAKVEADPTLLGRALGNILENAIRHAGGIHELRVVASESQVIVEIHDRGPGFPREILKQGFQPFVHHRASEGLGLGLALVDRIARAHGGRLRVESEPGQGSVVTLELTRHA